MNWRSFLAGVVIGAATAYMTTEAAAKNHILSSDHVLNIVKKQFKSQGPITGSWIHMQKEKYELENTTYNVYKGGITSHKNQAKEIIEFIADSKTGRILDYYPISV
ncbi:PepSY domain-containing protein [Niallia sp. 03133]|uniref:PepSY domain-containing protein n=1 Tax=Niallia sp. 03133 TaxID=3458060 RepID=UPI004043BED7